MIQSENLAGVYVIPSYMSSFCKLLTLLSKYINIYLFVRAQFGMG